MTGTSRIISVIASAAALTGLALASQAPMPSRRSNLGVLRLAWSARPERIEHCQEQSEAELARLPQHMRQSAICTGETASYRLSVTMDGTTAYEQVVRGGGLRHDRQLYVFQNLPIAVGDAVLDVRFTRIDPATPGDATSSSPAPHTAEPTGRRDSAVMDSTRRAREADERLREREAAVPAALRLTQRLRIGAGQVVLVKYDSETRQLLSVTEGSR